jgi:hypothetical protein
VSSPALDLVELGPDDALFPAWCEVLAASQRADRPEEPPRPASDHVALGRQLVAPGGSRDGTHRAAVVDGGVAGASGGPCSRKGSGSRRPRVVPSSSRR